ncbi:type 1 glutamine amidotransferase domain-containing protein [Sphingobium cupriresistens]|uniref:Glutamine amidotransferase n=1 Tax=Sphingobium cupriresistens LL01 TaxID=1420583 RepID=A0A0J7XZ81_9SPHN|nr:type 1 glutamine amidotransferase domain-containing protein [Sphingobium cupriresistens]KMS56981.1 glutamine amidotransferase [Sphingobium cupriresistens LL01]
MPALEESRILIIATNGFEQSELFDPRQALIDAGAQVVLASPDTKPIQGMKHDEKGDRITPDIMLEAVKIAEYDGLILPGGVANPDTLRMDEKAVALIRAFAETGKPLAAICHAPWLLVEADVVRGKTVTSWPSVRTDLANAGAQVVDQPVVIDGNIITSRKPDDIPAFVAAFKKAVGESQTVAA